MTWANNDYSYKKKISINDSYISGSLSNFPVLVNITDSDLKDNCRCDAFDIKFYNSGETSSLTYEREGWISSNGSLTAWVKVPNISSQSGFSGNTIWIYYGDSDATDQSDYENVWDSNYKGIWHIISGAGSGQRDSTSNNNDAYTKSGSTRPSYKRITYKSPDTNAHQGYIASGSYHIVIDTTTVYKKDASWNTVLTKSGFVTSANNDLGGATRDHIGDGSMAANGNFYFPCEDWTSCDDFPGSGGQSIIVTDSNLNYLSAHSLLGSPGCPSSEAAGIHVDSDAGYIYLVSYCDKDNIYRYNLSDFTYDSTIPIVGETNKNPQGIFLSGNYFYMTTDSTYGGIYKIDINGTSKGCIWTNLQTGINEEGIDCSQKEIRVMVDEGATECVYYLEDIEGGIGNSFNVMAKNPLNIAGNGTLAGMDALTIESLVYLSSQNSTWRMIFNNYRPSSVVYYGVTNGNDFCIRCNTSNDNHAIRLDSSANPAVEQWHYFVATYDGASQKIYVSGGLDTSNTYNSGSLQPSLTNVTIGCANDVPTHEEYLTGFITEVRVSDVDRGSDYIWTNKNNLLINSSFITLYSQESKPTSASAGNHYHFNYFFSDTEGITFREDFFYRYDLLIYYGNRDTEEYLDCKCSRWDVSDYDIIVETWLKKDDAQTLRENIVPGATGELFKVLGRPTFYDKTWQSKNTLYIKPNPSPDFMPHSRLYNMREEVYLYVQNYTEHPITNTDWIEIKIEGKISGTSSI